MSVRQGVNTIAGAVGKYPLNERNITNCITYIPQDINLELNNGTLTLKAGSKVYIPNGAGVFDEVVIESDLTLNGFGTGTRQMFVCYRNNQLDADANSLSGTSTPSGSGFFYNTSTNKIDYVSSGTALGRTYSFPLCIVTFVDSTITSIDQVFNGFGYIGSTVFALPGVKGLIPDGRNADGSLKNIATEVISVQTFTYTDNNNTGIYAGITTSGTIHLNGQRIYNEAENFIYNNVDLELVYEFAKYTNPSGKIADFTLKTAFHAVDYSDYIRSFVAEQLPTADNNYTWYRKYSNGWVEQGGVNNTGGSSTISITYPIAMANTNFKPIIEGESSYITQIFAYVQQLISHTTTGFKTRGKAVGADNAVWENTPFVWFIAGMAAS